jgi:hypothetical protein
MKKLVKESLDDEMLSNDTDKNLQQIKKFAEENDLDFGINKNGNPSVSMDVDYDMMESYEGKTWPSLVKNIRYTLTYVPTDNWTQKERKNSISLRKTWIGIVDTRNAYKNHPDPKKMGYNACFGFTNSRFMEYEERLLKLKDDLKSGEYKTKLTSIKQVLLGRFTDIDEALDRIKKNIIKEKNKK